MKANELRIGNWITYDDKPFQVGLWFFTELDAKVSYINDFEPIPLTEEWILKFGFAKIQNIYQRHNQILLEPILNGLNRSYRVKFWTTSIARAEPIYQSQLTIQYVHQLQNLYFALTGEELTIK